jgi:radical SAM superfamily enzyme YgiQ (UPF0313 family)
MSAPRQASNREIYLVQPKFPPSYWGLESMLRLTPFRAVNPPLGLLTLAALTPPDFRVTLCDENAGERVDYDTSAQIVGITGYNLQNARVYAHAERFRARGKTVVLGGPLANLLPDECRPYCDVLFQGEAEYTWPRFLRDYAGGHWADHYVEEEKIHLPDSPPPRLDLLRSRYFHGIVQCTRGCPFSCEFCDIIVMYGRKMRFKPIPQVLREVQAWQRLGQTQVFFADDNFVGHRAYAKELLRALAAWNRKQHPLLSFVTQVSIDLVRDEELLRLLHAANFAAVFIGIETPRKASLAETHKTQNEKVDLVQAIHTIQTHNLFTWAGMIVGFDHDDAGIFQEQYEFLQKAQIPVVMLSTLLAIPKTPLHARLKAEGRLLPEMSQAPTLPLDLDQDQHLHWEGTDGRTNFRPLRMSMDELQQGQKKLYQKLYSPDAFQDRLLGNLRRFPKAGFRPEAVCWELLSSFLHLSWHNWRQGPRARRFFWKSLWTTLRHSPRSLPQMAMQLGMYEHFAQVHADAWSWNPWKSASREIEWEAPPFGGRIGWAPMPDSFVPSSRG